MRIYIITDGEFSKIGISANPKQRLGDLQTANPRLLTLAYAFRCADAKEARRTEVAMHMELARLGLYAQGEWFKIAAVDAMRLFKTIHPRWVALGAWRRLGQPDRMRTNFESSLNSADE